VTVKTTLQVLLDLPRAQVNVNSKREPDMTT